MSVIGNNRKCISEHIPDGVCAVGRYCVVNEFPLASFAGSVDSARVRVDSCHGQDQIKDLFHRHYAPLLRVRDTDTVEYQVFRVKS